MKKIMYQREEIISYKEINIKNKFNIVMLIMLIMLMFGTVVFAARCPLCGSNGYSKRVEQYNSLKHKIVHVCPASTRMWWWNRLCIT